MSCSCPETNFMDGKGHDPGCPLSAKRDKVEMYFEDFAKWARMKFDWSDKQIEQAWDDAKVEAGGQ